LYLLVFFVLAIGNVLVYRTVFAPRVLEVFVLEAGKGMAILVRTPDNKTALVDAGSDASILRALGEVLPMWQRRIGTVALTSAKTDFAGGLPDVMGRYRIPTPLYFGTSAVPYGSQLTLDAVHIVVISPGTLDISYGATSLAISSTTPKGVYVSNGKTMTKTK